MGVFDDKKFEGLDWISQATEPIDSKMNEILNSMPESVKIDFDLYRSITMEGYGLELSITKVVNHVLRTKSPHQDVMLSYQQMNALEKCFKFESSSDELILDFENKIIIGELFLNKVVSTMDEDVLKNMLGSDGVEQVSYCGLGDPSSLSRMNEVMELLAKCEDGMRTRSPYKKRNIIVKRLRTIFKANEWNIRDTELANKVGLWIKDYIEDGNLAAFSNFCRLKVMTHKGQPIYSMEEIV